MILLKRYEPWLPWIKQNENIVNEYWYRYQQCRKEKKQNEMKYKADYDESSIRIYNNNTIIDYA